MFYFEGAIELPHTVKVAAASDSELLHGITLENFLPRGATMQGTGSQGILALVLYTGSDTKLVLN